MVTLVRLEVTAIGGPWTGSGIFAPAVASPLGARRCLWAPKRHRPPAGSGEEGRGIQDCMPLYGRRPHNEPNRWKGVCGRAYLAGVHRIGYRLSLNSFFDRSSRK